MTAFFLRGDSPAFSPAALPREESGKHGLAVSTGKRILKLKVALRGAISAFDAG
jgi:hypothetical protein